MRKILLLILIALLVLSACSSGSDDDSDRSDKTLPRTPVDNTSSVSTDTPVPTATERGPFQAVIESISPNPAHLRDAVTFSGKGIDPKGEIQAYRWSIQGYGAVAQKESFASSTVTEKVGTYTVVFEVQGSDGVWSSPATQTLTVAPWPPSAGFTATPIFGRAPLSVGFSDTSSKAIDSWAWDFGDGETSTLQNPLHTYVQPGIYTVSLTVTGPDGSDTNIKKGYIEAIDLDFVASGPRVGANPFEVKFTAGSEADIAEWTWDFGDGQTSALQNPTHRYDIAGDFTVKLTVGDDSGRTVTETKTNYIKVRETPPEADFFCHDSTQIGILENFTDRSTGTISTWDWDFGDGTSSTLSAPTHSYTSAGTYTVTLIVEGPGGWDTAQRTIVVE